MKAHIVSCYSSVFRIYHTLFQMPATGMMYGGQPGMGSMMVGINNRYLNMQATCLFYGTTIE